MPCEPVDEAVIERAMRVEDEHPALALPPCDNILPDERFEKLALPCSRAAADVEVLVALRPRECEGRPAAG